MSILLPSLAALVTRRMMADSLSGTSGPMTNPVRKFADVASRHERFLDRDLKNFCGAKAPSRSRLIVACPWMLAGQSDEIGL
jgi:hypothetical protein